MARTLITKMYQLFQERKRGILSLLSLIIFLAKLSF